MVVPSPPTMSANILEVMGSVDMLAPTDKAGPSFVYFVLLVNFGVILDMVEVESVSSVLAGPIVISHHTINHL